MKTLSALLLASILFALASVVGHAESNAILLKVIDGDTLKVRCNGQVENIRLIGIDTPEKEINDRSQRASQRSHKDIRSIVSQGRRSAEFMNSLLHTGELLRLEFDVERRDRYGRLLAYVYSGSGVMLNEHLLSQGYANLLTVNPNVRYVKRFQKAYQSAVESRKGLWKEALR